MREYLKFYIDGQWVDPIEPAALDVDNPTTEVVSGRIALGTAADVDHSVAAGRIAQRTASIDIGTLAPGLYLVEVLHNGRREVIPLQRR